jgi:hypothetical protein
MMSPRTSSVAGRGQRNGGRVTEAPADVAELRILGAEVVAPLADAVGLVDREKLGLERRQKRLEVRREEPLGGDVEQSVEADLELADDLTLVGGAERAVQHRCVDPLVAQLLDLILHQRDQRRDHDRQPAGDRRGELIAQRFARPRRHNAQHVLAAQDVLDHLPLGRAELIKAEEVLEVLTKVHHRDAIIAPSAPFGATTAAPTLFGAAVKWITNR